MLSISDNVEELGLSYTTLDANKYNQFGKLFGNNYFKVEVVEHVHMP